MDRINMKTKSEFCVQKSSANNNNDENYQKVVSDRLKDLRRVMKNDVDEAFIELGKRYEAQEKIEKKVKEFGLEENNSHD